MTQISKKTKDIKDRADKSLNQRALLLSGFIRVTRISPPKGECEVVYLAIGDILYFTKEATEEASTKINVGGRFSMLITEDISYIAEQFRKSRT